VELGSGYVVLMDISGYTRFVRMHRTSAIHAELVLTELLEKVIDTSRVPLNLNRVEGDGLMFFAAAAGTQENAQSILQQVLRLFHAFAEKERELVSCNICVCEACNSIDGLRMKAVLHHGEIGVKRVKQFEELTGEDVILAHRLLKNSVETDQYIMMTENFHRLAGDIEGVAAEARVEQAAGIGDQNVRVFAFDQLPAVDTNALEQYPLRKRLGQLLRFESYLIGRLLGLVKRSRISAAR
jgi:hypothetical protein